ncbi:MAG: hypothetical protein U9Q62_12825 [Campylobacterota bacterium]|nr:hypothetical protein [Campylobacterota bacterium]
MEKVLGVILVMVYVVWLMSGGAKPSSSGGITEPELMPSPTVNLSQKQMHDVIKTVGKNCGWVMTEYKSNALIAEKMQGENAISATITFDGSSFTISSDSKSEFSKLQNAINRALR